MGVVGVGTALSLAGLVHSMVNARLLRRPGVGSDALPPFSVLIPARDEAADIGACVASALGSHEVVVLDDGSTDGTGSLAAGAGARVVAGAPLPAGWLGKPWACAQLVAAADPAGEVLVFLDADVRLAPGAVPAAVRLLLDSGLDVVCPFPRQQASGVAERLVQPLLQWSWLTTLPLRVAERSPRPSLTSACGQFLVVRRSALDAVGGFTAVRGAVLDDLALVRAIKAAGGSGGDVDGSELATCRMYRGWTELRDGYSKSLWSAFGSPAGAVLTLVGFVVAWVVPPVAAARGSRVGLLGYLAAVANRIVCARRTGGRAFPDAAAHPVSVTVFGWLTLRSLVLRRRGSLRWKGRPVG